MLHRIFTATAVQAQKKMFNAFSWAKNTARGVRFLLGFNMYLSLAQYEQVCLFLALTHIYTIVQTNLRVHTSPLACTYIARRTFQDNGVAGFHRAITRYGSMGRKKPFIIFL